MKKRKMKKLVLIPYGGLGNRVRFIETTYKCLKNHPDVRLVVLWMKNADMASYATDLFEVSPKIKMINISAMNFVSRVFSFILWKTLHFSKNFYVQKEFDFDKFLNSNGKVFFCEGCDRFCEYNHLEVFTPKGKYVEMSKNIADSDNYASMHIRRTDNNHSINKSPTELFIREIENEIMQGRKIYIASDDLELKKELKKKYGSSIMMQSVDKVTRNDFKGMEEAMIDLLCLARSKKIYGSFGSTFSSVASYVYGTPLEILRIE